MLQQQLYKFLFHFLRKIHGSKLLRREKMKQLTSREIEIIKYTAKGHTSKEIAKIVGLEYRTVQAYLSNIRKKVKAKNIAHAIFLICSNINEIS